MDIRPPPPTRDEENRTLVDESSRHAFTNDLDSPDRTAVNTRVDLELTTSASDEKDAKQHKRSSSSPLHSPPLSAAPLPHQHEHYKIIHFEPNDPDNPLFVLMPAGRMSDSERLMTRS